MVRVARATPDTTASWRIPSTSHLDDILADSLLPKVIVSQIMGLSRSLYEPTLLEGSPELHWIVNI